MKPISITIEGINSFTTPQTVDFERVGADNLFCISGSTGSGKSTILDCLIMSLYEKEGSRGNLNEYVNLRCEVGKIDAIFEINGARYRTQRVIKKKGTGSFVLTDLSTHTPIAEGKEAYAFLREKIGLDVKEFTKVVVLQQGEFAKFLKANSDERNDLISKLFSLKKYDGLYNEVHSVQMHLDSKIKDIDERLAEFEGVSDEALAETTSEYEKVKTEGDATARLYEKAQKTLVELTQKSSDYAQMVKTQNDIIRVKGELKTQYEREEKAKECEKGVLLKESEQKQAEIERDELTKKVAELEIVIKSFARLMDDEKQLSIDKIECEKEREKLEKIKKLLAEKNAKKSELATKLAEIKSSPSLAFFTFSGERSDAPLLKAKVSQLGEQKERIKNEIKTLENEREIAKNSYASERAKWESVTINDAKLSDEQTLSEEKVNKLIAQLETIKTNNAVAVICSTLTDGDECPICHGKIEKIAPTQTQAIDEVEKELTEAQRTLEKIRANKVSSSNLIATLSAMLVGLDEKIADYDAKIKSKQEELDKLSETLTDEGVNLASEFCQTYDKLEKLAEEIVSEQNNCDQDSARNQIVEKTLQKRESEIKAERQRLGEGEEKATLELTQARARIGQIEKNREEVIKSRNDYEKALKDVLDKISAFTGELKALESSLKIADKVEENDLINAQNEVNAHRIRSDELNKTIGTMSEKVKVLSENLAKKKKLASERKSLDDENKQYADLSKLFHSDGFRNFIVSEFIKEVAEVASGKLSALTGGKYTLEYDGDFYIYDFLSGNEKRRCSTLSGGETFLTSLALAIAISNELAKTNNFDFFFIDEGFGTLSPEALDTAVDALKELSKDTLVGVISHRKELIERIGSEIKVESASAEEGSKIFYR